MKGKFAVGAGGKDRPIDRIAVPDPNVYPAQVAVHIWGPDDILFLMLDLEAAEELAGKLAERIGRINAKDAEGRRKP